MREDAVAEPKYFRFPDGRLSANDAAAYVGLSPKTLAMMRCRGDGPPFVKRGRVFYFEQDLKDWMQAGRVRSTAQSRILKSSHRGGR